MLEYVLSFAPLAIMILPTINDAELTTSSSTQTESRDLRVIRATFYLTTQNMNLNVLHLGSA